MSIGANAFFWGILSAVSLPLGAILGLWLRPKRKVSSALMAFGAGALLFALTIELFGHVPHHVEAHGFGALWAAVIGAVAGGVLFEVLNRVLNNRGAYLRRFSNARRYVARLRLRRAHGLLEEVGKNRTLRQVKPEHMAHLLNRAQKKRYPAGELVFQAGDESDALYFIISGEVVVHSKAENGETEVVAKIGEHDTFGEIGILHGRSRSADVWTTEDTLLYRVPKADLDTLMEASPELRHAIKALAEERIENHTPPSMEHEDWRDQTLTHLKKSSYDVSVDEIHQEGAVAAAGGGAALAIWLGILIDGVPESLVIGMLATSANGVSFAFIAGVFLANLPEAMSSAVSMRNTGMRLAGILAMWTSICVITGIGAWVGAVFFPAEREGAVFFLVLGIEGLAAGAMLTMIAETMLPEAFEQGGSVTGLSTLAGFLTTLLVKVL